MNTKEYINNICKNAKDASVTLAKASTEQKNGALTAMAEALKKKASLIISANKKDIKIAKASNETAAFIDRLSLDKKRIESMAACIDEVAKLNDPCGEIIKMHKRPNGLIIAKMRTPIGVIGIIYESRPNVTSDCAALCLKSGNAVILKGGRESINSNKAICDALKEGLRKAKLPLSSIQLIELTRREATNYLLGMDKYLDLVIPRGGEALIKTVAKNAHVPVIKHYKGICHVYVDKTVDLDEAYSICYNAKVQRPGVCNAMESMLIHRDIASSFLPEMLRRFQEVGVEIRGCDRTRHFAKDIKKATLKDYATEYLDLILSVKVVNSLTEDHDRALRFLKEIDSACVYSNASTRFTDGYEFGMGAEIGISTDKIHARGPMALEELTTYKYIIFGKGQIRQ